MDYSALQPGAAASDAIRTMPALSARSCAWRHGASDRPGAARRRGVRLSGRGLAPGHRGDGDRAVGHSVAGGPFCPRRGRHPVATLIGLIMTTGVGLLVTGRLNLISVAFIPLFVGLGIDFSIQFSVRFLAERHLHPGDREALTAPAAASAAAGAGRGRHRRRLLRLPADRLRRRGRTRDHCRPRHGHRLRLSITLLPALLALLRPAPGGWMRSAMPGWRPSSLSQP